MSSTTSRRRVPAAVDPVIGYRPGPLGRLGVAVTRHARLTTVVWLLVIIGLGAFAPRVEADLFPSLRTKEVAAFKGRYRHSDVLLIDVREALFATMSRNARDAADYFRVPTNRVIELGTQVEI